MTPEERDQVDRFIEQMKGEDDEAKLSDLIRQFIIARKQRNLEDSSKK